MSVPSKRTQLHRDPAPPARSTRLLPGVLATLTAVIVCLILGQNGTPSPHATGLLLLAVAFASIFGRVRAGLISAAIGTAYCVVALSIPGRFFRYTSDNQTTLIIDAFELIAMALIVGMLKRRSDILVRQRIDTIEEVTSEKYRGDQTLRRFAELEAVIEGLPAGIYIGTDEGLSLCNKVGLQMFGYDRMADLLDDFPTIFEILDARWYDTGAPISPADHPFTCAQRGEQMTRDLRYKNAKTGADTIVRCAVAPIVVDFRVVAGIAVHTDITERIRMEESLRESEESYRRLIDTAEEGIWIIDPEGKTTFANDRMARMLADTVEAMTGKPVRDYVDYEEQDRITQSLERQQKGTREQVDIKFRRKDGAEIWTIMSSNPIFDKQGKYIGALGMVTDITERKRAQNELDLIYQREHRIAETLQRSLLLTRSDIRFPGFDVDAYYQSALEEALVGGDFFDAFPLENGLTAFLVGDVSGKGLEAAARTAETKFTLRALLREKPSPAIALGRMNDILCDRQRIERGDYEGFICLAVIVANHENGHFDLAIAGAEPPIIMRASGTMEVIATPGGMALGVLPDQEYVNNVNTLAYGDTLLITTDGLTEARRTPYMFGVEGLCRAAEAARHSETLQELAACIVKDAAVFAGGKIQDDVCLLMVRRIAEQLGPMLPANASVQFRPSPVPERARANPLDDVRA